MKEVVDHQHSTQKKTSLPYTHPSLRIPFNTSHDCRWVKHVERLGGYYYSPWYGTQKDLCKIRTPFFNCWTETTSSGVQLWFGWHCRQWSKFFNLDCDRQRKLVLFYNLQTKWQLAAWLSPKAPWPQKVRPKNSRVKTILIAFFDSERLIHLNATFCLSVLKQLVARIRRISLEYSEHWSWCLLHDNAKPHTTHIIQQYFIKN